MSKFKVAYKTIRLVRSDYIKLNWFIENFRRLQSQNEHEMNFYKAETFGQIANWLDELNDYRSIGESPSDLADIAAREYNVQECLDRLEDKDRKLEEKNRILKELLRCSVNELEEQMNNLCETVADFDSPYSPCLICSNDGCCTQTDIKCVRWVRRDDVEKALNDK